VVNVDAFENELRKNSHDFVHERLLLINLPAIWQVKLVNEIGGNEFVGRSLGSLLRHAGAQNIEVRVQVEVVPVGEYRRTHLLSLLQSMRGPVLASGLISTSELSAHMAALSRHLADPKTTLIDKLMVQAWGVKP
jgi:hypothetical protein